MRDVICKNSADVGLVGRIAARLVDAYCHLQKHGAAWEYHISRLFIDQNYEPRIGVCDDMCSLSATSGPLATDVVIALTDLFDLFCVSGHIQENRVPSAELRSTIWTMQLFGTLVDAGYRTLCQENIIRPAEISRLIPLSQESWMYLQQADNSCVYDDPSWGAMLSALASGTKKREGHILHATYDRRQADNRDRLQVFCVDDDVDEVYHTKTHFEIPRSAATEVIQELGIDVNDYSNGLVVEMFSLQRFAGPGETIPTCTGWVRGCGDWSPWWCAVRRYSPESHRNQFDWDAHTGVQAEEIQAGGDTA